MIHRLQLLFLVCLSPALVGCQGYDVTINERVVYTPVPLFMDFDIPDPALRVCVEETIQHEGIRDAAQLATLNCSNAGITTVQGLATFEALTILRLSSNQIRNLVELQKLAQLRELYLNDNLIIDPVPVSSLPSLQVIDLSENAALQCPKRGSMAHIPAVTLPQHCK